MSGDEKRIGRFRIQKHFIEQHPEIVKEIMGKCVIIRAEFMYCRGAMEYEGESDLFWKASPYEYIPLYEIIINRDDFGRIAWHFKKTDF